MSRGNNLSDTVLDIQNISVKFNVQGTVHRAVDGVSLQLKKGEILAVVGESGCGKTTLAKAVLGIQPIDSGNIILAGRAVDNNPSRDMASRAGMVWQDPYASMNPKWTISRTITEPFRLQGTKGDINKILEEVGLGSRFAFRYPHQLSGGQRQRAAIGRALALKPPVVICDEPTAALDLSVQAQILNLLKDLQKSINCSYLYISHDLMTVRFLADRVAVMYLGRIVEQGPTEQVFENPQHPYTKALLGSAPNLERIGHVPDALEGELPDPRTKFVGCRFASRCEKAKDACKEQDPPAKQIGDVKVWCYYPGKTTS